MRYFRAYQYVFDSPKWGMNLLFGSVCQLIPIIGPIVFLGYSYDVIEAMHGQGDRRYPDFDFNRFVKYLVRGLWPFLVQLIVLLPVMVLVMILLFAGMATMAASMRERDGGGMVFVVLIIMVLAVVLVEFLLALVMFPLTLQAGLSQEFALSNLWEFLKDFLKRVWKELVLALLFLMVSSLVVSAAGLLLFCIGVYPATVLITLAHHHFLYQLYELYLQRGGKEIPLKVESVSPWNT